jgi:hypothetical protein
MADSREVGLLSVQISSGIGSLPEKIGGGVYAPRDNTGQWYAGGIGSGYDPGWCAAFEAGHLMHQPDMFHWENRQIVPDVPSIMGGMNGARPSAADIAAIIANNQSGFWHHWVGGFGGAGYLGSLQQAILAGVPRGAAVLARTGGGPFRLAVRGGVNGQPMTTGGAGTPIAFGSGGLPYGYGGGGAYSASSFSGDSPGFSPGGSNIDLSHDPGGSGGGVP